MIKIIRDYGWGVFKEGLPGVDFSKIKPNEFWAPVFDEFWEKLSEREQYLYVYSGNTAFLLNYFRLTDEKTLFIQNSRNIEKKIDGMICQMNLL